MVAGLQMAIDVVLFGKEGCHLCEAVESEIRSSGGTKIKLKVVDIEGDPALQSAYWMRVPVVTVAGKEVFEAKMMDLGGRWRSQLISTLDGLGGSAVPD